MIMEPFSITAQGGAVTITLEVFEEEGRLCCGIYQLDGRITLPPKAWLRLIRSELEKIENVARQAGCAEIRVAGRDWSRVLTGWTPLDGVQNGLRKVLV